MPFSSDVAACSPRWTRPARGCRPWRDGVGPSPAARPRYGVHGFALDSSGGPGALVRVSAATLSKPRATFELERRRPRTRARVVATTRVGDLFVVDCPRFVEVSSRFRKAASVPSRRQRVVAIRPRRGVDAVPRGITNARVVLEHGSKVLMRRRRTHAGLLQWLQTLLLAALHALAVARRAPRAYCTLYAGFDVRAHPR